MEIRNKNIDNGKAFDWGRTSGDYAKYRDIYPPVFYEKIVDRGLCVSGQKVLDLGTGTGVLPRNMYHWGAGWTGIDLSEEQIAQAKRLSEEQNQKIQYLAVAAEDLDFPDHSFDVITACQCFWYFDPEKVTPLLSRLLKEDGSLLLLYMAWLPFEDEIARESERLVLKYSPGWTGAGEMVHPITVDDRVLEEFAPVYHEEYRVDVPFTRESWNGRMKACRGVGASLTPAEVKDWEREHRALLEKIAPEHFSVKHYGAMLELRKRC